MTSSPPPQSVAQKRKHNLSAAEQQAAQLERLLANADKPVHIPQAAPQIKTLRAPREMMKNVSGSSAGAGSGEFHVYKHSRRREFERVRLMEEQAAREQEERAFEERKQAAQAEVASKTSKNRAKRDKKKAARLAATAKGGTSGEGGASETANTSPLAAEARAEGGGDNKRQRINAQGAEQIVFKKQKGDESEEEDEDE